MCSSDLGLIRHAWGASLTNVGLRVSSLNEPSVLGTDVGLRVSSLNEPSVLGTDVGLKVSSLNESSVLGTYQIITQFY